MRCWSDSRRSMARMKRNCLRLSRIIMCLIRRAWAKNRKTFAKGLVQYYGRIASAMIFGVENKNHFIIGCTKSRRTFNLPIKRIESRYFFTTENFPCHYSRTFGHLRRFIGKLKCRRLLGHPLHVCWIVNKQHDHLFCFHSCWPKTRKNGSDAVIAAKRMYEVTYSFAVSIGRKSRVVKCSHRSNQK